MSAGSVLVVDDHPIFRHGIAALLSASGYEIVGQAASAAEAVAAARASRPDVVLMDLGLPDESGLAATGRIVGELPDTAIVVVTMYDDDGSVRDALAAGAAGYIVKDAAPAEILAAVSAAIQGATVLGSGVSPAARGTIADRVRTIDDPFNLTPREREVLDLVVKGLTNAQIGGRLGIAGKTVADVVSVLLAKSGAADRVELAAIARESLA